MVLKIVNNTTKKEYTFDELKDNLKSNVFYSVNLTLPDNMEDGEYTYMLFKDNKVVSRGLLQIGDYERETIQHNNDKKGYVTYNG